METVLRRHDPNARATVPAKKSRPRKTQQHSTPKPAPKAGKRGPGHREQICKLAAARLSDGISSADIATLGIQHNHAGRHTTDLVEQGRLFRAQVPGQRFLRWFATAQARNAWLERTPPATLMQARPKRESTAIKSGAAWTLHLKGSEATAKAAGVSISPNAGKVRGEVIIPPGVKRTICPSPAVLGPAALVALQPGARPFGAGFAAIGVGRDVTTGQAWEMRG